MVLNTQGGQSVQGFDPGSASGAHWQIWMKLDTSSAT